VAVPRTSNRSHIPRHHRQMPPSNKMQHLPSPNDSMPWHSLAGSAAGIPQTTPSRTASVSNSWCRDITVGSNGAGSKPTRLVCLSASICRWVFVIPSFILTEHPRPPPCSFLTVWERIGDSPTCVCGSFNVTCQESRLSTWEMQEDEPFPKSLKRQAKPESSFLNSRPKECQVHHSHFRRFFSMDDGVWLDLAPSIFQWHLSRVSNGGWASSSFVPAAADSKLWQSSQVHKGVQDQKR
jgi:hypothetical protein